MEIKIEEALEKIKQLDKRLYMLESSVEANIIAIKHLYDKPNKEKEN